MIQKYPIKCWRVLSRPSWISWWRRVRRISFSTMIMGERVHSNQPRSSSILPYLAIYCRKLYTVVAGLSPQNMIVKLDHIFPPQIRANFNKSLSCLGKKSFFWQQTCFHPPHLQHELPPQPTNGHLFTPFLAELVVTPCGYFLRACFSNLNFGRCWNGLILGVFGNWEC